MSNPKPTCVTTADTELADLPPEIEELSTAEAEQAHGGLLPAVQPGLLLPAVQPANGGYVQPGTIAGAFDAFRN